MRSNHVKTKNEMLTWDVTIFCSSNKCTGGCTPSVGVATALEKEFDYGHQARPRRLQKGVFSCRILCMDVGPTVSQSPGELYVPPQCALVEHGRAVVCDSRNHFGLLVYTEEHVDQLPTRALQQELFPPLVVHSPCSKAAPKRQSQEATHKAGSGRHGG